TGKNSLSDQILMVAEYKTEGENTIFRGKFFYLSQELVNNKQLLMKKLFLILSIIVYSYSLKAYHLMVCSLNYQFLYHDTIDNTDHYHVKLQIYRDCNYPVQFVDSIHLGAYSQDTMNPNANKVLYRSFTLVLEYHPGFRSKTSQRNL